MPENISPNNLEVEIQELEKKIEAKRRLLEADNGVVEEKNLVREAVGEMVQETFGLTNTAAAFSPTPISPAAATQVGASYLDTLDDETTANLNTLIADLPQKGIKKTIQAAQNFDAYTLDAFHDLLIDRLYNELKARGLIK